MPFGVGVATFVVMITGHMLFTVVDQIVEHGVGMPSVLKFIGLQVPFATLMSLPAAALLASGLALNRLASENELTAMRAGGAGAGRLLRSVLLLGVLASLVALGLGQWVVPWANHRGEMILQRMIAQRPTLAFQPGKFTHTEVGLDFFAEEVDSREGRLHKLYVFERTPRGGLVLFQAEAAHFTGRGLQIGPAEGYAHNVRGELTQIDIQGIEINLGDFQFTPGLVAKQAGDMSLSELLAQRKRLEQEYPGSGRRYSVELHFRISLAFSCLVFVLMALPITLSFARGESLVGVLATLLVVFAYYVIMLWLRMVAEAGLLPPLIAAWLENGAIVIASGLVLWRHR